MRNNKGLFVWNWDSAGFAISQFGLSQIQRPSQNYTDNEDEASLEEKTYQTWLSILPSGPEGHQENVLNTHTNLVNFFYFFIRLPPD